MVLIDIEVDLGDRDGFVNRGGLIGSESYYLNPTSTYLQIFATTSTAPTNSRNESRAYVVFTGITIPLGAVIANASLSMAIKTNVSVGFTLTVEALKENDPATPTSVTDGKKVFTGLKANATATTLIPSTQTAFATHMVDVKDMVQELVNAFTYNNQRMFFTVKTGTKDPTNASIYAFENGVGQRASLIINFSAIQTCVPTSDISNVGVWEDTTFGNSDTDLFDELDETVELADDDTTAVRSPADPQPADTFEVKLDPCLDPITSVDHKIRIRVRGSSVKIQLFEGVTLRAESGIFTPTGTAYETFEYILSGGEADSITDYSDLRIRVVPQ